MQNYTPQKQFFPGYSRYLSPSVQPYQRFSVTPPRNLASSVPLSPYKTVKGESRFEYVPYQKKIIQYEEQEYVQYIPKERKVTDYYAVEYQIQYIPQKTYEKQIEYVPVEKYQERVEYQTVQKQYVLSQPQQQYIQPQIRQQKISYQQNVQQPYQPYFQQQQYQQTLISQPQLPLLPLQQQKPQIQPQPQLQPNQLYQTKPQPQPQPQPQFQLQIQPQPQLQPQLQRPQFIQQNAIQTPAFYQGRSPSQFQNQGFFRNGQNTQNLGQRLDQQSHDVLFKQPTLLQGNALRGQSPPLVFNRYSEVKENGIIQPTLRRQY